MADRYWVGGSGSQSFVSTANWSTARYGAGGASVPTSADVAYILDGSSTIDQGLTTCAWNLLHVGFNGTIGTSGQALVNSATSGGLYYYGTGPFAYIGNVRSLRVWSTGSGTLYVSATDFDTGGSGIEIGPSTNVVFKDTAINMGWEGGVLTESKFRISGGNVTIENGNVSLGGVPMIAHGGAKIDMQRKRSSTYLYGRGTVYTYSAQVAGTGDLDVYDDATYNHASATTIPALDLYPNATVTDYQATGAFTVTSLELWPKANLFPNRRNVITISSETRICQP